MHVHVQKEYCRREIAKVFVTLIFHGILMLLVQIMDVNVFLSYCLHYQFVQLFAIFNCPEKLIMVLQHDLDIFFFY